MKQRETITREFIRFFRLREMKLGLALVGLLGTMSLASSFPLSVAVVFLDRLPTHRRSNLPPEFRHLSRGSRTNLAASVVDDFGDTSYSKQRRAALYEFEQQKATVIGLLKKNDNEGALRAVSRMVASVQSLTLRSQEERMAAFEIIDSSLQAFFIHAFAPPYRGRSSVRRVSLGVLAMKLQLSSGVLEAPFNTVPKYTMLSALKALTNINELRHGEALDGSLPSTDAAYRVLQRLVTGNGIRNSDPKRLRIHESDFNMVLNAYSNVGRMDMAHRVIALQQRTAHAPSLSPVAYSILLKGYGRLRDLKNLEMILSHADASGVEPDTVMMNSLIDSYANCLEIEKAREVLDWMKNPLNAQNSGVVTTYSRLFRAESCPRPNRRTFNTFLKGLANAGALAECIALSREMEANMMWDEVTTNTLVHAAVTCDDFSLAENILEGYTVATSQSGLTQHPNVEAYTKLLDGYAKAGDLDAALATLKKMRERKVEPTEVTYTCAIGALARYRKIQQAKRMLGYMKAIGLEVTVVAYNSLISGLLSSDESGENFDRRVDEAIAVVKEMMKKGIRPNTVTVTVILDAFARCERSRISEAKALVSRLENEGIISANNTKIATALVQVCGIGRDLNGALQFFRKMQKPDLPAVNAFIDACIRCGKERIAMDTFDHYFRDNKHRLIPDVKTFSILIAGPLGKNSQEGMNLARKLYEEMRSQWHIMADKVLVDM